MSRPERLTRVESRERTRTRLLEAARDVFERHGYAGASLEAVAEAAGYTKGAVYSNFATKADLFLALLERTVDAERELQEAQIARTSFREFIDQLDALFDRQVVDDPLWVVLQIEFWLAAVRDPEIRARLVAGAERIRARSGDAIERAIAESGAHSPFTGAELGVLINALGTGLAIQHQVEPGSFDPKLIVRAARRLAGLDHSPAAPESDGSG